MTASPSRPFWWPHHLPARVLLLLGLTLASWVTLVGPATPPALAQSPLAALTRMKELYRQSLTDYAAEDFESARIGLREAISVGERHGVGRDPVMARVLMAYGAVLLNGYKDAARADRALTGAAILMPDLEPVGNMETPALRAALVAARAKARVRARAMGLPQGAATPTPGAPPDEEALPPAPGAAPPAAATAPVPDAGTADVGPPVPATIPPSVPSPSPSPSPPLPGAPGVPPVAVPGTIPAPPPAGPAAAPAPPAPTPPVARRRRRRGPGEEPDLPANIPQPLYCPSADEAPPETDIVLHCVLRPDVTASKVLVFYREAGKEQFSSASTTKSSAGWIRAVIPARVVQGRSLQYYLEARDAKGTAVANAGRDDSPNLALVREDALPLKLYAGIARARSQDGGDDEDGEPREEDDPLRAIARQREREREAAGRKGRAPGAIFGGLGAGMGYGWHPTSKLEFYDKSTIEAGWIPSGLFHLLPEVGYQLSDQVALSVLGRVQFISQQGSGDQMRGAPASGAFLLLGRLQYLLGAGPLQTSLSLYAGGGDGFRLTIPPTPPNLRNDSVRGGPMCGGGGVGLVYHVSRHVAVAFDAKALYGFPTTAAVIDGTTALQLSF